MANSSRIDAAGGLLWHEVDGQVFIAVVHRDRYDDWSLPKGKVRAGELLLHAAVREVGEESGSQVSVSRRLGEVRYRVDGSAKVVRFWAMRHVSGEFSPSLEVDKLLWLEPEEAKRRLSYPDEREIVDAFLAVAPPMSVVILVRHAKAGKRSEWTGPDRLRPLDSTGRTQAKALASLLQPFAPVRVVAADPLRCVQTLQPLAARLKLSVEVDRAFADEVSATAMQTSRDALAALEADDTTVAVCSQGDTIAALIGEVATKGAAWVLSCRSGHIISRDYYGTIGHRRNRRHR